MGEEASTEFSLTEGGCFSHRSLSFSPIDAQMNKQNFKPDI
jgi:hypothetical protein